MMETAPPALMQGEAAGHTPMMQENNI